MTRPVLCRFPRAVHNHDLRRFISLWKSIKPRTMLRRDVVDLDEAGSLFPNANSIRIELLPCDGKGPVHPMYLDEYLTKHAEPGKILVPRRGNEERPVPSFIHKSLSAFPAFKKFEKLPKNLTKLSQYGHETHFTLPYSSPTHVELSILKMYGALFTNSTAEVQLHAKGAKRKDGSTTHRTEFANLISDYIHLRPDVLLASMPAATGFLINPQTDFTTKVAWVLGAGTDGSPPLNLTYKFTKARASAIKQKEWVDYEMTQGRYWNWNADSMMPDKLRAKKIRNQNKAGGRPVDGGEAQDNFPQTVVKKPFFHWRKPKPEDEVQDLQSKMAREMEAEHALDTRFRIKRRPAANLRDLQSNVTREMERENKGPGDGTQLPEEKRFSIKRRPQADMQSLKSKMTRKLGAGKNVPGEGIQLSEGDRFSIRRIHHEQQIDPTGYGTVPQRK